MGISLAIWCNDKDRDEVQADLHLNLWSVNKLRRTSSSQGYNPGLYRLDIGLMVKNIRKISKIYIFLPFSNSQVKFTDLGGILGNNVKLTSAIFNEDCRINRGASGKLFKVGIGDKEFDIYALSSEGDVAYSAVANGTLFEITTKSTDEGLATRYFRLQFTCDGFFNVFGRAFYGPGSLLNNITTAAQMIDLRVNEYRNIHSDIAERIKNESRFSFDNIHFLLLRKSVDNLLFSYNPSSTSRGLEADIWSDYLHGYSYSEGEIQAYHWKEKGRQALDPFTAFVKIQISKLRWKAVFIGIVAALAIGICANIFSTYLVSMIQYSGSEASVPAASAAPASGAPSAPAER